MGFLGLGFFLDGFGFVGFFLSFFLFFNIVFDDLVCVFGVLR